MRKNIQKTFPYPNRTHMSTSTMTLVPASASAPATTISDASLPNEKTLKHAARMAMEQDKPIMLDYYADTRDGKAFLGEDASTKEQMLVRSESEYTSGIEKKFKVAEDFIIITQNSIYIIAGSTKKKTISAPA
jgi:hypothetical protein